MPRWRTTFARLRRRIPVSLGAKLVAILTGVALLGAGAVTLLLALVITPGFDQLEQAAVEGHVERTRAALTEYASKVEASVRDYGDWSESYDYMGAPNKAFEEDSFATSAMINLGVNGMAYVTPQGKVVIARWLDIDSGRDVPAMRSRMLEAIGRIDLATALAGDNSASFYVRLGDQIAAIGIAQVRRTDGTGEPRGHVVMARLLSSKQLSTLLQVKAALDVPHPVPDATVTRHEYSQMVAVPIRGPGGVPVASATYSVSRDLSALGRNMLLFAVGGTVLLLLVVMAVLSLMIARLVLRPLHRVERHMGLVRSSGDLLPLTEKSRGDEIGSLVNSFNGMLSQLKDLREQVEAQSFKLGQSESAVAVMHNVRNALNPVSTVLSQGLAPVPVADRALVDRALAELADPEIPAVRRQKLAAFLAAAFASEARAREERDGQMAIGRDALQNVLEIIGRQQEQAHERPPLDPCDVTDIVARNATIARYSGGSSIAFHFPSRAQWALANRVLLSQVIGNLFANAAEAIAATGHESGSISVTIREHDGKVEIAIRDDGEGFDPEIAAKLFQRGFSTRESKMGGLGLHWCANSMIAMGGSLALRSDGRGTGARAVLTLQAADAAKAGIAA
ncbi:HAMP domain-containing protein [Sphingomonas koreensis]|uniref:histidine kinase n=1 Tax=Sphingomonas koreensis TaxID=93064 RepID=A0A430G4X3_9SPHN|nr:CHASE4 domain-containing protein [Sphingomonas koreensis]RSY87009.1 HAMP domain-containing protein [Sphingomonas koreensis]